MSHIYELSHIKSLKIYRGSYLLENQFVWLAAQVSSIHANN